MISKHAISRYALAWTPFLVLWVLLMLVFTNDPIDRVLLSGIESTLSAALLGIPVWWISARVPWPDRITPRFCLVHVAAVIPYALGWAVSAYLFSSLRMDEPLVETIVNSDVFRWRVLMGAWLYAIVAGVSHAVRNRNRLREQERIASRAEALALEARLAALRAQLNPHFLFNALHSANALIRRDPEKAEQAVEQLADLLRYTLDEGNEALVPLDEEWAFTRGYLKLQSIRFGDKLRYVSEFADGSLSCLVPPFILQPLVENAVEHGISTRTEGGEVRILGTLKDGVLVLRVEDDGSSARNGRPGADLGSGHGSGLAVLRQRLEALYGERGRLEVRDSNGTFEVTVTIPV